MKIQLISSIASLAIIMNTIGFNLTANAKVIEPEIVKTETWTTSYYIDDDIETLYPYIDCQADIYNDGTVKVYFWNTHEWDGFATVKHTVTMIDYMPVRVDSVEYSFKYNNEAKTNGRVYHPISEADYERLSENATEDFVINDNNVWDSININYYPKEYKASNGGYSRDWKIERRYSSTNSHFCYYNDSKEDYDFDSSIWNYEDSEEPWCSLLNSPYGGSMEFNSRYHKYRGNFGACTYNNSLPEMLTNEKNLIIFTPKTELNDTYNFRIFGHEFIISPDILSGNPVSEPQPSASEQKIKELEEKIANLESENASLKAENEQLKNGLISDSYGDINHDNIIDGRDASMLLTYYAKTSTGYTGTLVEFVAESKNTVAKNSNDTE